MCIGEKRTLTVPPSYGYGQRAIGPIPAGSVLSMCALSPPPFSALHITATPSASPPC